MIRVPMSGKRIETWSGNYLDLSDPDPAVIMQEDILVGLSNCCRFAGQSRRFYSVAEHSVLAMDLVKHLGGQHPVQWFALMHDAGEAFYHDLTAPLKYCLRSDGTAYDDVTARVDAAIADRFNVYASKSVTDMVAVADQWAFVIEAQALLASGGAGYNVPDEVRKLGPLPGHIVWYAGLTPYNARELMRARWDGLFP